MANVKSDKLNLPQTYILKPDFEQAAAMFRKFWQFEKLDRPLIEVKIKKSVQYAQPDSSAKTLWQQFQQGALPKDLIPLLAVPADLSRRGCDDSLLWHCNYCRRQLLTADFCFESMPKAVVMLGRDLVAMGCLAGGDFVIDNKSEFVTFIQEKNFLTKEIPDFDEKLPFAKSALAIYKAVCGDLGNLGFVNPPTTADALTTIAMLMGESEFLKACVKRPLAILHQGLRLNKLFYGFYNYIYEYLLSLGYGWAGSWFPVVYGGRFDSVRSDVSVMLSAEMFRNLALPLLADACNYLDCAMFNLDSVRLLRFLPEICRINNLRGIYWNLESQYNDFELYLPILKKLKNQGMTLAIPCPDLAVGRKLVQALGADGLLLEFPVCKTADEAKVLAEKLYVG